MPRRLAKWAGAILCAFPALAAASFSFTGEGRYALLEKEVSYRIDDRPAADYEKVIADEAGWISQRDKPFPGTRAAPVAWARFDLPSPPSGGTALIRTLPWEHIEYFIYRDGRLVDRQRTGVLVPWTERTTHVTMTPSFISAGFVSAETRAGSRTTVYARLQTTNRYDDFDLFGFSAWDARVVRGAELRDGIVQGLFCGVMLFLIVYNLGLWLVTRESSFFFYVVMEVGFTLVWAVIFGLTSAFLWPEHPWWDHSVLWLASNVGGFGMMQFLRHYLGSKQLGRTIDAVLKYLAYYTLATMPLALLFAVPYDVLAHLMVYSGPVGAVLVVAVIVRSFRARHALAPNLLVAMSLFAAGIVVYAAAESGILPRVELTVHAAQIGSVLMGVVLSLGLGFRMRNLREQLAHRELEDERLRAMHEREKRELVEEQNRTLESKVIERTAELMVANEKSDALLANILPQAIIAELRASGEAEPRRHEEASILFTDFSGFTQAVATMPPRRLVQELNEIFRGFDDIVTNYGLEKIKTIGDAYMAAGGLPVSAADHAVRCVRAAMALARFIEARNQSSAMKWGLRVGVHSGAVVAGIVGKNKYAYDVWGDTVNIASRLESSGEVNRVNISAYTFELVREHFECEYRGKIAAKGKGDIDMYFVLRERVAEPAPVE